MQATHVLIKHAQLCSHKTKCSLQQMTSWYRQSMMSNISKLQIQHNVTSQRAVESHRVCSGQGHKLQGGEPLLSKGIP